MTRATPVHTALTAFRAEIDGHVYDVLEGERVVSSHPLVARFPERFEEFTLRAELAVRSERIRQLKERDTRTTSSAPLSRAGRAEREETRFWSSTVDLLERSAPNQPSAEQRAEADFYTSALDLVEQSEARELAEVNTEAERAYGFDRGWARRVSD